MKKFLLPLLFVTACTPATNSTLSPIESKKGGFDGKANISFRADYNNTAKVTATTTDGEMFEGYVISDKSEFSATVLDDDFGMRYSARATAVLISKDHSMKCSFTLASPSIGITAGAVGECKVNDGRVIPVAFGAKSR